MATNRIIYSQAGQTGKLLAQAVDTTLDALAQVRRVKTLMDRATTGNDWAALAAELGAASPRSRRRTPGRSRRRP